MSAAVALVSDSPEQLERSNPVLGIRYFGLPISLVFAVFRYHQRDIELTQHIEQLERIWHNHTALMSESDSGLGVEATAVVGFSALAGNIEPNSILFIADCQKTTCQTSKIMY